MLYRKTNDAIEHYRLLKALMQIRNSQVMERLVCFAALNCVIFSFCDVLASKPIPRGRVTPEFQQTFRNIHRDGKMISHVRSPDNKLIEVKWVSQEAHFKDKIDDDLGMLTDGMILTFPHEMPTDQDARMHFEAYLNADTKVLFIENGHFYRGEKIAGWVDQQCMPDPLPSLDRRYFLHPKGKMPAIPLLFAGGLLEMFGHDMRPESIQMNRAYMDSYFLARVSHHWALNLDSSNLDEAYEKIQKGLSGQSLDNMLVDGLKAAVASVLQADFGKTTMNLLGYDHSGLSDVYVNANASSTDFLSAVNGSSLTANEIKERITRIESLTERDAKDIFLPSAPIHFSEEYTLTN